MDLPFKSFLGDEREKLILFRFLFIIISLRFSTFLYKPVYAYLLMPYAVAVVILCLLMSFLCLSSGLGQAASAAVAGRAAARPLHSRRASLQTAPAAGWP